MNNKITEDTDALTEVVSSDLTSTNTEAVATGSRTLEAARNLGKKIGDAAAASVVFIGDLNGDGKVDAEDAKIAYEKAKQVGSSVADESAKLGKEVMQSELVKDVAPYAAVGAAIAVPIPIIGPVLGAAVGAALGLFKSVTKKNNN